MNKNKENYIKAVDKVKPTEELKENTFKKVTEKQKKKNQILIRYTAALAIFVMCLSIGVLYTNNPKKGKNQPQESGQPIANAENDLPRFTSEEELRKALISENYKDVDYEDFATSQGTITNSSAEESKSESSHSETNTQVKGVDEADIIKTDGNYIYYVSSDKVHIIKSDEFKIESTIQFKEKEKFYPIEIYVVNDKLVVIGEEYNQRYNPVYYDTDVLYDDIYIGNEKNKTKIIVYDISNKEKPRETRTVKVDGSYETSRMIGNNLYTVSDQYIYSYYYTEEDVKDLDLNTILPTIEDSENDTTTLKYSDIAFFKDSEDKSFMNVIAFDIEKKEKVQVESFFGTSNNVYASTENLYVTQTKYDYTRASEKIETTIYKFNLNNAKISLQGQSKVSGRIINQFAMDEYNGNLRVATTSAGRGSSNKLYILDKELQEIGRIGNFSIGESIYSVRFIGKVGYVVTFKQTDPLFTLDLSDPSNPRIRGKLEIPGYSSYLHPYDETHIIGIGHNTETNQFGGTSISTMKMSMFDISDLDNPEEIFNISIGEDYTYSEISNNHKALFYHPDKNLIGFVTTTYENGKRKNEFKLYKIDLEKGFEEYGSLENKEENYDNIKRAIYINDEIYLGFENIMIKYNLETLKKEEKLELE